MIVFQGTPYLETKKLVILTILAIILTRGSLVQQRDSVLLTVEISLAQELHARGPLLGCEGLSLREEKDPGVLIEILQPLSLL